MCDDTKDEEDEVEDEVPNTGDLKAAMAGLLRLLVGRRDGGEGGEGRGAWRGVALVTKGEGEGESGEGSLGRG